MSEELPIDHDRFHEPTSDDPMWTETCWFPFYVPERRLSGTLYPLFRRNLGVCSGGVHIWDDSAHEPHRILYNRNLWHLPFPEGDLTDVSLANGLRYQRLEPSRKFAMQYEDGDDLRVDLVFEAIAEPHFVGGAHLDQPGRVQGTLVLDGEEIAVDCHSIRDRSWSVRDDVHGHLGPGPATNGGYSYGTSPEASFQAISTCTGDEGAVRVGYVIRDGRMIDVASGTRRVVSRHDGHQTRVEMSLTDVEGVTTDITGECHNAFAWQFTPNYLSWICLFHWTWDGGEAWGEDHDNWTNTPWRAFRRTL